MQRVITLTTDFGTGDGYVAVMKGVVLGINPEARLVDVSHAIEPQSIRQASFILHTAWRYFPDGSIHLAVVDPGVGSHRRAVILRTPTALFVAPDNGILSYVLHDLAGRHAPHPTPAQPAGKELALRYGLPEGCEAVHITRQEYWRHPVSGTFHGRDIFAPVAAHLSLGLPIGEFGEPTDTIFSFPIPVPFVDASGGKVGHIVHIDRFGNLVTNLRGRDIPAGGAAVEVLNQRIAGTSSHYAHGEGLMAVIGSNDYLELSVKDGSAAALLGARIGDTVKVFNTGR